MITLYFSRISSLGLTFFESVERALVFRIFQASESKRKTNEERETGATGDARHAAFSKIG